MRRAGNAAHETRVTSGQSRDVTPRHPLSAPETVKVSRLQTPVGAGATVIYAKFSLIKGSRMRSTAFSFSFLITVSTEYFSFFTQAASGA